MKLISTLEPTLEGTLLAEFGAVGYLFAADGEGLLVADVNDDEHALHLLDTGHFYAYAHKDTLGLSEPESPELDLSQGGAIAAPLIEGRQAAKPVKPVKRS